MNTTHTQVGNPAMPGAPHHLRCEYLVDPMGLDERHPRLSWLLEDARRGAIQTAYQVQVGSSPQGLAEDQPDIWDSGKIASSDSVQVDYDGPAPKPATRYYWRVRTWDAEDQASPWSAAAYWETGLDRRRAWRAKWIGLPPVTPPPDLPPSPFLRRTFRLEQAVLRARLCITARGLYLASLNGRAVTDDLFRPGWTDYGKRLPYQVYDVTDLLQAGDNVMGVILGAGWYCGHVAWMKHHYGSEPRLLARLEVICEQGAGVTVVSDRNWKGRTGPIVESDFLMGETYDARLELEGWNEAGLDDSDWNPVLEEPMDRIPLVSQPGPPVHRAEELKPVHVSLGPDGSHIVDFGQNMVGYVRMAVPGDLPAGDAITLRHAEVLNPDGALYTENLRKARATDRYISRGAPATWEPHFTFHGFRYAEVQGWPGTLDPDALTGVVVQSEIPQSGDFSCSHDGINQLQHNILWGLKGNFLEVPTDCPQRDERLGWTGDAQVFVRTACFNTDVAAFYEQWMRCVEEAQTEEGSFTDVAPDVLQKAGSPAWIEAGVIVPWTVYLCYGDRRILDRHYPAMKQFLRFARATSEGLVRPAVGYGDWVNIDAFTALDLISTAYFARAADLMARIAGVLGRNRDARGFAALFRRVRRAFQRRFVTPDGRLVSDTQTAYTLALRFNLLPDRMREPAAANLERDILHGNSSVWPYPPRDGHISTGFVGCSEINFALADTERLDLAYQLLLNEDFPSWLFPVKNGATTIWERWDGWTPDKGFQDPGMNSFNHYTFGSIGQWLYQVVAGIDLAGDEPGYRHILFHPRPGGSLTWARAALQSVYGPVESSWRIEDGRFLYEISAPPNTRATVVLPCPSLEKIIESERPLVDCPYIRDAASNKKSVTLQVPAGRYWFACPYPGE